MNKKTRFQQQKLPIVDNLNHTEPVKKILQDLMVKNERAFRVWAQLAGRGSRPRRGHHYTLLQHPQHMRWPDEGELPSDFFQPLPFRGALPKLLLTPDPLDLTTLDPVTQPFRDQQEWTSQGLQLIDNFNQVKWEDWRELDEKVMVCPQQGVSLAKHLTKAPHPHLASCYNWTWAGAGVIHIVPGLMPQLLYSRLHKLYLSSFSKEDDWAPTQPQCVYDCGERNYIMEIAILNNHLALRTEHSIYILSVHHSDSETKLSLLKKINSKVMYTGISFDNFHKYILYISVLDNSMVICNLNSMHFKKVMRPEKVPVKNNWNPIIGYDRLHYIQVSGQKLKVFTKKENTMLYSYDIKNVCDSCNIITLVRRCEGTPYLYIGTLHHLLLLDIRSFKDRKPEVLMKWTHGMESPPINMGVVEYQYGQHLICLSSQWCEDMCIIVDDTIQNKLGEPPTSTIFPYKPPTILHTFKKAQLEAKLLNIYLDIEPRLKTCITGCLLYESGLSFKILFLNSLGDFILHELHPVHLLSSLNDTSMESLEAWAKNFQYEPGKFSVTRVCDVSPFWMLHWHRMKTGATVDGGGANRLDSGHTSTRETDEALIERELLELRESEGFDIGLLEAWHLDHLFEDDSKDDTLG